MLAKAPIRGRYLLYFYVLLFTGIGLVTGGVMVLVNRVPEMVILVGAGLLAVGVALGAGPGAAMWERIAAQRGPFVEWDEATVRGPGGWSIDLRQDYRYWVGYDEYTVRTPRFTTRHMRVFCRMEQGETVVTLLALEGTEQAAAMGLERCVLPDDRGPEIVLWSEDLLGIIGRVRRQ